MHALLTSSRRLACKSMHRPVSISASSSYSAFRVGESPSCSSLRLSRSCSAMTGSTSHISGASKLRVRIWRGGRLLKTAAGGCGIPPIHTHTCTAFHAGIGQRQSDGKESERMGWERGFCQGLGLQCVAAAGKKVVSVLQYRVGPFTHSLNMCLPLGSGTYSPE